MEMRAELRGFSAFFTAWFEAHWWVWTKCSAAKAEAGGFRSITQRERKGAARPATSWEHEPGGPGYWTETEAAREEKRLSLMSWLTRWMRTTWIGAVGVIRGNHSLSCSHPWQKWLVLSVFVGLNSRKRRGRTATSSTQHQVTGRSVKA